MEAKSLSNAIFYVNLNFNQRTFKTLRTMYDPYASFERFTLPNGLTVYHQYWDRPWVEVKIVVHAGAREDPANLPGLAHFLEHCVSNNIKGYRKIEAEDFLRDTGGRAMFGSTSYLATMYGFALPVRQNWVKKAFAIYGKMMLSAKISQRISSERLIINQEFHERYPASIGLEWEQSRYKSLFPGHRLEIYNRPLGRPEGFLAATRQDLQSFYDTYYVPANISIVILGGVKKNECRSLLEVTPFAESKPGTRNGVKGPTTKPLPLRGPAHTDISASSFTSLKREQTGYEASWSLPGVIPTASLFLATELLDRDLEKRIREKLGGSYGFSADYSDFQDVQMLVISGQARSDLSSHLDSLVRASISRCSRDRRTFDQLKSRICRRLLMTDLSGRDIVNGTAADLANTQKIETLTECLQRRRHVSFEDIKHVFRLLSEDRAFTFIIRP